MLFSFYPRRILVTGSFAYIYILCQRFKVIFVCCRILLARVLHKIYNLCMVTKGAILKEPSY